jgi:hypothetical protein
MKTASLALAKFAIILVCCISPTLGNKRIVRQLRLYILDYPVSVKKEGVRRSRRPLR